MGDFSEAALLLKIADEFTFQETARKYPDHQVVLYKAENPDTGNYYIGSTGRKTHRLYEHLSELRRGIHHNPGLQKEFDQNPNLEWTFIPVVDEETAFEAERLVLKEVRGDQNCLNVKAAVPFTEERRAKISQKHRVNNQALTEQQREERSVRAANAQTKRWDSYSEDEKQKHTAQIRELGKSMAGIPKTEEAKERMREARQRLYASGWKPTAESIQKNIESNSNRVMVDGVVYPSQKAAGLALGVPLGSLQHRFNSPNHPNWVRL